jgi:large subunit ribosomal protein L18
MLTNIKRKLRKVSRLKEKIKVTSKRNLKLLLCISNSHISCQIIDSTDNATLASASSMEKSIKHANASNCNKDTAKKVGELIANRASDKGIREVVFSRGAKQYHHTGKVGIFCKAAREKLHF